MTEMKLLKENQNEPHIYHANDQLGFYMNPFYLGNQMIEEKEQDTDKDQTTFTNIELNNSNNNEIGMIDYSGAEQEYDINLSSKDITSNQTQLQSNSHEEQFNELITNYANKLQYSVKRVKQQIKKGQQIRKKKLFFSAISNLFTYNIKLNHKFMIFGYIILEDQYKDYDDQYSPNLINQYDDYIRLEYIEKDNSNQIMSFCVTSIVDNLMKKFKTICQYYENAGNADYKQLADLLRKFETFINIYDEQWKQLYEKYTPSDIENFLEIYKKESNEYIKTISKEEFLSYQMFNYNLKFKQLEPYKNGNSFDACTLVGLHIDLIEKIIKKVNSFQNPTGKQRMQQVIQTLEFITSGLDEIKDIPTIIKTIDGITISLKSDLRNFRSNNIPKDVNDVFKCLCIIHQYHVDLFEIKRIMCERGDELMNLYKLIDDEPIHIETTIMKELFLEKYYPEQYNKLKGEKQMEP